MGVLVWVLVNSIEHQHPLYLDVVFRSARCSNALVLKEYRRPREFSFRVTWEDSGPRSLWVLRSIHIAGSRIYTHYKVSEEFVIDIYGVCHEGNPLFLLLFVYEIS